MSVKEDYNDNGYIPENKKIYEYYCNIMLLKNIKSEFNAINHYIICDHISLSPLAEYNPGDIMYNNFDIYYQYEKFYNDFNYYIDKLIKKENIDNYWDYQETMHMLMVIVCDLNEFIHKHFILNGNKDFLKQKIYYNGKERSLEYVLLKNIDILYKLKSNTRASIITKYFYPAICWGVIFVLFFISIKYQSIIFAILTIAFAIIYLKYSSVFKFVEKQGEYQLLKYHYSAHPYESKYNFVL